MTQPQTQKGAILEPSEFAYLLGTLHAPQVVGVDAPDLFPKLPGDQESLYLRGRAKLLEHGWLKQLENPSQYILSPDLLYWVAVVADPKFVVFTIRSQPDGTQRVLLHYLAEPDIIELSVLPGPKYALAVIPDRAAMLGRVQAMLDLPQPPQGSEVRFMIEEPAFVTIQDLAEDGQSAEAAALLKQEVGVNGNTGDSLVKALEEPDSSSLVVVVRPNQGKIEAGRKASLFRNVDVVWLAKRVDAKSNTYSIETVQADTLPSMLETYLEFLSK